MRRCLLSFAALTCLFALGGCQSCSTCGSCGGGGAPPRGAHGASMSACHWHGVCDCLGEDQCIMRQPWAFHNPPYEANGNIVPATLPAPLPVGTQPRIEVRPVTPKL